MSDIRISNGRINHSRITWQPNSIGINTAVERSLNAIDRIVTHYTVSGNMPTIENVNSWWRMREWNRAGYHLLIRNDGSIWQLVPIHAPSWGAGPGANPRSIHIAIAGNFTSTILPSRAARESYGWIVNQLLSSSALPNLHLDSHVTGHRDWMATTCPGFSNAQFRQWIIDARQTTTETQHANNVYDVGIQGFINARDIPLRNGPGAGYTSNQTLAINTPVIVLGSTPSGNWVQIRLGIGSGGRVGWVRDHRVTRSGIQGYINARDIPLRNGPGANHTSNRTLSINSLITVLGSTPNGNWVRIRLGIGSGGRVGWVRDTRFTRAGIQGFINAGNIPLRDGPGAGYTSNRTLSINAPVIVIGSILNGNWIRIRLGMGSGGRVGWVRDHRFTRAGIQGFINASDIPLRNGPGASHTSNRTLSINAPVIVLRSTPNGDWVRIRLGTGSGGRLGWVRDHRVTGIGIQGFINASGVPLRNGPGAGHTSDRTLLINAPVAVLGSTPTGNWVRIRVGVASGGRLGWVRDHRFTRSGIQGIINANNIPLRNGPGAGYTSNQTLTISAPVIVLETTPSGNWIRIRVGIGAGGRVGWVRDNRFTRAGIRAFINAVDIPLRNGPGASYTSIQILAINTSVIVIGSTPNGNWVRIRVGTGAGERIGWVRDNRVTRAGIRAFINAEDIPLLEVDDNLGGSQLNEV